MLWEVLFGANYVDITTQSNHELRMSSPGYLAVSKMADGGGFDSFYFNCRRIRDFSKLKAKDKSKVRKARAHRSFSSLNASNVDSSSAVYLCSFLAVTNKVKLKKKLRPILALTL